MWIWFQLLIALHHRSARFQEISQWSSNLQHVPKPIIAFIKLTHFCTFSFSNILTRYTSPRLVCVLSGQVETGNKLSGQERDLLQSQLRGIFIDGVDAALLSMSWEKQELTLHSMWQQWHWCLTEVCASRISCHTGSLNVTVIAYFRHYMQTVSSTPNSGNISHPGSCFYCTSPPHHCFIT